MTMSPSPEQPGPAPIHRARSPSAEASADELDALLGRLARGDAGALGPLYDALAPRLFALTTRVLGAGPDAEEALQEAFLKAWRHADQWPGRTGTSKAWLTAIARNAAIDRRRARSRQTRRAHSLKRGERVLALLAPVKEATPEERSVRAADAADLSACLDELPAERAEAVREAYFTGESYAEIAERTGRPEGTLKSWVHRSLSVLRACLERRGVRGLS